MINIRVTEIKTKINIEILKKDVHRILCLLNYSDYDLGIWFATNKEIQYFNKEHRDKNQPTDILSFPYHYIKPDERIKPEKDNDKNLGDIIIAPQYVKDTLDKWPEKTLSDRLRILLVHGICHLLGYDHIKDEDYKIMKEKEDWLLTHIDE